MSNREAFSPLLERADRATPEDVAFVARWATAELERRIAVQSGGQEEQEQHRHQGQEDREDREEKAYDPAAEGKRRGQAGRGGRDRDGLAFK